MDGLRNSVTTDGDVVRDLYINEELGGSNDPFILFSKSNRMQLTVFSGAVSSNKLKTRRESLEVTRS